MPSTHPPASPIGPALSGCGACGKGGPRARGGRASGKRAARVDPAIKAANLKHLRRIQGQVGGLIRMVEDDRYCADIVMQLSAVRESLHSVARNLLRNHLKHCAAAAIRKGPEEAGRMHEELVDLFGRIAR